MTQEIRTFMDQPLKRISREPPQNSGDAVANPSIPVLMKYELIHVDVNEICEIDNIRKSISGSLKEAQDQGKSDEITWFQAAEEMLASGSLPVLKVSDYETAGCNETGFDLLWQGVGDSDKSSLGSGGSRGVGKHAFLVNSGIHLVFFTSFEKQTQIFRAAGLLSVRTHELDSEPVMDRCVIGQKNTAHKFPDCVPISIPGHLPKWLNERGNTPGTSCYVMGFNGGVQWKQQIEFHLATNLFTKLHRGEIEFDIVGHLKLNKDNLIERLTSNDLEKLAKDDEHMQDALELAKSCTECLSNSTTIEHTISKGQYQLKVHLLKEGNTDKVTLIRNGMLITSDNPVGAGDKFIRFVGYRNFTCIIEPLNDVTSELYKRIEDSLHENLSLHEVGNPDEEKTIKKIVTPLGRDLRKFLQENLSIVTSGGQSEDLVTRYIPSFVDGDTVKDGQEEDMETPVIGQLKDVKQRKQTRVNIKTTTTTTTKKKKSTKKSTTRKMKRRSPWQVDDDWRNIPLSNAPKKRKVFFTTRETVKIRMALIAPGADPDKGSIDLVIAVSNKGKIADGKVEDNVLKGVRNEFEIEFEDAYEGPLDIRIQGI